MEPSSLGVLGLCSFTALFFSRVGQQDWVLQLSRSCS